MSSLWRVLLILAGVAAGLMGSDADLDRIPHAYIDGDLGRMRCSDSRGVALAGEGGLSTACAIYTVRSHVRRACLPGDDSCKMARRRFNL
jgi:uncharacterized protein